MNGGEFDHGSGKIVAGAIAAQDAALTDIEGRWRDHRPRGTRREPGEMRGIADKDQFVGLGAGQRGEATQHECAIALDFTAEEHGQIGQPQGLDRSRHDRPGYRASSTDTGDVRATEAALLPRK